jgi:hypothetical protein
MWYLVGARWQGGGGEMIMIEIGEKWWLGREMTKGERNDYDQDWREMMIGERNGDDKKMR